MSSQGVRLAFFIMLHRYPEQFRRLFRSIYDPGDYYVVHVDRKSPQRVHRDIAAFLRSYPNAWLLPSTRVTWGGWSQVTVQLQAIRHLLEVADDWGFVTNLSGQCFPLRSRERIRQELSEHRDRNFIDVQDMAEWPPGLPRVRWYWVELSRLPIKRPRPIGLPVPRRYLTGARPYHGSAFSTLNRAFVEWVTKSPEVDRFKRFYRWSVLPEEGFLPSVVMHSPFRDTVAPHRRTIVWTGGSSPKTYTREDLDFLLASNGWYARKFDATVDSRIIDLVEANLADV